MVWEIVGIGSTIKEKVTQFRVVDEMRESTLESLSRPFGPVWRAS